MIYCYNCGKKNGTNEEFCKKCSTQLFHGMPGLEGSKKPAPSQGMSKSDAIFYGVCSGCVGITLLWAVIFLLTH